MITIVRLFLASALLFFATTAQAQTTKVDPDPTGMELTAQEWCKNVVMGWNLGNALECLGDETSWGNPKTTKEMIHQVREAGFNAIRIPIRWSSYLTDKEQMTINPTWLTRVKEVVDWCLDEGMYVLINDHHEDWYDRNPFYAKQEESNRKLSAMWTNIAVFFRDYDDRLAFAGTNETTVNWATPTEENLKVQNSYNQTFVNAVRTTGGKNFYRNLVVQTYACNPYHGLNGFVIPEDQVEGHLSVEYHYYDPYGWGLLTNNAAQNYYYWGEAYREKAEAKGKKVPSDNEKTQASLFNRIQNAWWKKGLGVVMGEFGVTNHYTEDDKQTQQENMQYYLKTTVSNARERGFATFVWDNNGFGNGNEKFGIFNRQKGMAIGNEYFLKGLSEGSVTTYKEPEQPEHANIPKGANILWEGNEMMDWGNGLQVTVPGSEFASHGKDVRLYLSYTLDYNDYNMIQFFYGDWTSNPTFMLAGSTIEKEYAPSDIHGADSGDDCLSEISFPENVYNVLTQKGLAIQGHGVRMKTIALSSPSAIRSTVASQHSDTPYYNLKGQRVAATKKGLYIKDNKKYILK